LDFLQRGKLQNKQGRDWDISERVDL